MNYGIISVLDTKQIKLKLFYQIIIIYLRYNFTRFL